MPTGGHGGRGRERLHEGAPSATGRNQCPLCAYCTQSADLVQGDAKLRENSGDADATENHKNGSER